MNSNIIILTVTAIALMGFVQIIKHLLHIAGELHFIQRYRFLLRKYAESDGLDTGTYEWLIEHSQQMQWTLGEGGILPFYRPPYRNLILKNYPVVINLIPELRQAFDNRMSSSYSYGVAATLEDILSTAIGAHRAIRRSKVIALLNPIQWFTTGIQVILKFPISLFRWIGIITPSKENQIKGNRIFAIITRLVTVISFTGAIIGITVDWERFYMLLKQLFPIFP